jgi:type IV pilus assembly protein PilX
MTAVRRPGERQRGAALIVGLLMLVVLTVLAVTGMSTAAMELAMAGNQQQSNRAFEAAASLLEAELRRSDVAPLAAPGALPALPAHVARTFLDGDGQVVATASAGTDYLATTGLAGWQLGTGQGFDAHHFEAQAGGTAARGAATNQTQGYYLIGPSP